MPNRILRDGILTSERVSKLGWAEEVFYRRLMSIVDDYGRCEANQQLLRSRCYPLQTDDVRLADISRWMAACQKSGLILEYAVQTKRYIEILDFKQQQRTPSKCPDPPANAINCSQPLADEHLDVVVVGDVVVDEVMHEIGPFSPSAQTADAQKPKNGNHVKSLGTRLPDGWFLPDDWKAWAVAYRTDWDEERIIRESLVFRDYWYSKPGKDGRKAHWLATWRNWVRRTT